MLSNQNVVVGFALKLNTYLRLLRRPAEVEPLNRIFLTFLFWTGIHVRNRTSLSSNVDHFHRELLSHRLLLKLILSLTFGNATILSNFFLDLFFYVLSLLFFLLLFIADLFPYHLRARVVQRAGVFYLSQM